MIGKRNNKNTKAEHPMKSDPKSPQLTMREKEIISLVAKGKTSPEISGLLSLPEPTIKKYIKNARIKLNATNKAHVVAIAVTLGLIASVHPTPQQMDEP